MVAIPDDVVAAKEPDRALVLGAHGHRHRKPVIDVGAPKQAAAEFDDDVF